LSLSSTASGVFLYVGARDNPSADDRLYIYKLNTSPQYEVQTFNQKIRGEYNTGTPFEALIPTGVYASMEALRAQVVTSLNAVTSPTTWTIDILSGFWAVSASTPWKIFNILSANDSGNQSSHFPSTFMGWSQDMTANQPALTTLPADDPIPEALPYFKETQNFGQSDVSPNCVIFGRMASIRCVRPDNTEVNVLVVGDPNITTSIGAVYSFELNNDTQEYSQTDYLQETSTSTNSLFGYSLFLHYDDVEDELYLAVGCRGDDSLGTDRGSVQVARYNFSTSLWTNLTIVINGTSNSDNMGDTCAMGTVINSSGDRLNIVLGAANHSNGDVMLSKQTGLNTWGAVSQTITSTGSLSPRGIELLGDTLVIMEYSSGNSGKSSVYQWDSASETFILPVVQSNPFTGGGNGDSYENDNNVEGGVAIHFPKRVLEQNCSKFIMNGGTFTIKDSADDTKVVEIVNDSGQTTGTTAVITLPSATDTLLGQTNSVVGITNKTFVASTPFFSKSGDSTTRVSFDVNTNQTVATTVNLDFPFENGTLARLRDFGMYAHTTRTFPDAIETKLLVPASYSFMFQGGAALTVPTFASNYIGTGSDFVISSDRRFQPKRAGTYLMTNNWTMAGVAGRVYTISLFKNVVQHEHLQSTTARGVGLYDSHSISVTFESTSSDTWDLRCTVNAGVDVNLSVQEFKTIIRRIG